MDGGDYYRIGVIITWVLVFIGSYIYCIAEYGFLLGVGLGWLPSAISASVVAVIWPIIALVILVGILFIVNSK